MCGIAGYIGPSPRQSSTLNQTLQLMQHRGPDANGIGNYQFATNRVQFLHTRLSIIDLDPRSNQPFASNDCSLIFNGEIYNYLEIKSELESLGFAFETCSDTEVLLKAYLHWGPDCTKRFEGMWAFALFDQPNQRLLLSRDRFGEKPLYLLQDQRGCYFGSEIKFIECLLERRLELNQQHLLRYLVNGFRSLYKSSETFYHKLRQIEPGTNVLIDRAGDLSESSYWSREVNVDFGMTLEQAISGFRSCFNNSLKLRLRADVPLAFCLSGGVDSAAIVSTAKKVFACDLATYSIVDNDKRYDETDNILATVRDLGCKNKRIEIGRTGFFERLSSLISAHDGPLATVSYYVHSFLSEAIAQDDYKVVLSGTAADELLAGYFDHYLLQLYELRDTSDFELRKSDWIKYIKPLTRNPELQDPERYIKNPNIRDHLYLNRNIFLDLLRKPFNEDFYESAIGSSLLRKRMLNELFYEIVPCILNEDDLNSMQYSIENRSPFLDSKLFEFCHSIPPQHLIKDGYSKFILREALTGTLNEQVRLDRHKKGFNASINSLVDFRDPKTRSYLLADSPVFELIDREKLQAMFDNLNMPNSLSKFMFQFINTKLFLEQRS